MHDKEKTCKDCPDRQLHCHASCDGYQKRKAKRDNANEQRRKEESFFYGRAWKKRLKKRKKEGERWED